MARFMDSNFPPGLLNPGPSAIPTGALEEGASWCVRVLGVACPNKRELFYNLFLSSRGVWLLLPLSVLVLLLYRLVGPPEVDEREEQLRQQWEDHKKRFKAGAKRSSLQGIIKSSYLTELGGTADGRAPNTASSLPASSLVAVSSVASSLPPAAEGSSGNSSSDDGWQDVGRGSPGETHSEEDRYTSAPQPLDATAADDVHRLPPPRETVHALTTPGPTRVTIVGYRGTRSDDDGDYGGGVAGAGGGGGGRGRVSGKRTIPIVTLHAAGHNHRTCLGSLEREAFRDEELRGSGVVFYHVDTPGHEEEESRDVEATALSLEAQAAQLLQVTIQLGLEYFVGLGVGAGANVLLRFACDNPDNVAGLIVANGSADKAGRRERNAWLPARFRLSWDKNLKTARESLIPLSFPPHSSLASRYRAGLGTMNARNVLKYVDASLCRDDIPAKRLQDINDIWTLLLCGTEPADASGGVGGFLASVVAGVDGESSSRSLLDKLRRAADSASAGRGAGVFSKATLVTLAGGGSGGGLLEAKPLEALAGIKLFLNKCF